MRARGVPRDVLLRRTMPRVSNHRLLPRTPARGGVARVALRASRSRALGRNRARRRPPPRRPAAVRRHPLRRRRASRRPDVSRVRSRPDPRGRAPSAAAPRDGSCASPARPSRSDSASDVADTTTSRASGTPTFPTISDRDARARGTASDSNTASATSTPPRPPPTHATKTRRTIPPIPPIDSSRVPSPSSPQRGGRESGLAPQNPATRSSPDSSATTRDKNSRDKKSRDNRNAARALTEAEAFAFVSYPPGAWRPSAAPRHLRRPPPWAKPRTGRSSSAAFASTSSFARTFSGSFVEPPPLDASGARFGYLSAIPHRRRAVRGYGRRRSLVLRARRRSPSRRAMERVLFAGAADARSERRAVDGRRRAANARARLRGGGDGEALGSSSIVFLVVTTSALEAGARSWRASRGSSSRRRRTATAFPAPPLRAREPGGSASARSSARRAASHAAREPRWRSSGARAFAGPEARGPSPRSRASTSTCAFAVASRGIFFPWRRSPRAGFFSIERTPSSRLTRRPQSSIRRRWRGRGVSEDGGRFAARRRGSPWAIPCPCCSPQIRARATR